VAETTLKKTSDGRRLCVSESLDHRRATVWDVLTDTAAWPDWGPSVTAVECANRHIEVGSTGRVQVLGEPWVPFEITACRGYRWTWEVARIPATGHCVEPLDSGRTRLTFEIPPLAAGYAIVCRRAIRNVDRRCEAVGTEP